MHLSHRPARKAERGFTLVELMASITLLGILLALAAPSFAVWIKNTKVRTVSETLQNGVRLAQAEAVRRNRGVSFFLTNDTPSVTATAIANGKYWGIRTLPLLSGETATFVRGGAVADVASNVTITGPLAICFSALGRQTANATEGCAVDATAPTVKYDITMAGAERALRVLASISGQVRMCDPNKTLSDAVPDGCPPVTTP